MAESDQKTAMLTVNKFQKFLFDEEKFRHRVYLECLIEKAHKLFLSIDFKNKFAGWKNSKINSFLLPKHSKYYWREQNKNTKKALLINRLTNFLFLIFIFVSCVRLENKKHKQTPGPSPEIQISKKQISFTKSLNFCSRPEIEIILWLCLTCHNMVEKSCKIAEILLTVQNRDKIPRIELIRITLVFIITHVAGLYWRPWPLNDWQKKKKRERNTLQSEKMPKP